jgi:uncharacterized membrane protein YcaP (DUF421 family)
MWNVSLHPLEFVLRGIVVYVFLLVILRLTGKRQVGQLAPFDLVLLLVISNAVQNAMNGGDNSVTGGIILCITLVGMNWLVGYVSTRSKTFATLVEGRPTVLIHEGKIQQKAMRRARMTMHELMAGLRAEGLAGPEEVRTAMLENNGRITVVRMKNETK